MEQELNRIIEAAREKQQRNQMENPTRLISICDEQAPQREVCRPPIGIPPKYRDCTLESFQGNDALVRIVTECVRNAENIVFTGKTGCGKTHLAIGASKAADITKLPIVHRHAVSGTWDSPPAKWFTTLPEVLLRIRDSFREKTRESEADVVNYFSDIDCLVLDDLGAEKPSEFSIATLYLILDRRVRNLRQTIITTNLDMQQVDEVFGARIASRMAEMKIVKINMPDYRKRRA